MALRLVKKDLTDRTGTVTVEGDSQEEVMSSAAKQFAIQEASSRVSRAGVSGNEVAYPVDSNGECPESLVLGQGTVVAYRCDYKITGGL